MAAVLEIFNGTPLTLDVSVPAGDPLVRAEPLTTVEFGTDPAPEVEVHDAGTGRRICALPVQGTRLDIRPEQLVSVAGGEGVAFTVSTDGTTRDVTVNWLATDGTERFVFNLTPGVRNGRGKTSIGHVLIARDAYTREVLAMFVCDGPDREFRIGDDFAQRASARLSEFRVIAHRGIAPDPASAAYQTVIRRPADARVFNNTTDHAAEPAPVQTYDVQVAGVRVVLEDGNDANPLWAKLKDSSDVARLTISADEVIVRTAVRVPGATVSIHARRLVFEDTRGEVALIDTTPLHVTQRAATRATGLAGQRAGDIELLCRDVVTPGTTVRLIAKGGCGQEAKLGAVGTPGKSMTPWDGTSKTPGGFGGTDKVDWSEHLPGGTIDGYTPVCARIWMHDESPRSWIFDEWLYEYSEGTDAWPTSGGDPVDPGRPGQGGSGGTVSVPSNLQGGLAVLADVAAGEPGKLADDVPAAPAGTPRKACHVIAGYEWNRLKSNEPIGAWIGHWGDVTWKDMAPQFPAGSNRWVSETHDGRAGKAPGPDPAAAPQAGRISPIDTSDTAFWVHAAAVRAVLTYARDAVLAGHEQRGRAMLQPYRDAIAAAPAALDLLVLRSELDALAQQIDGPFDAFGNPAGWVPMLSFETNLGAYQNERDSAIRTMFLAHWIRTSERGRERNAAALTAALRTLRDESNAALAAYETALGRLRALDATARQLTVDIDQLNDDITAYTKSVTREVRGSLEAENAYRSAGRALGGVLQVVPVYQPVLGAFGKAATAVADIDLDKPLGTVAGVAGSFSVVAQQKLLPKVEALFADASDAERTQVDAKEKAWNEALDKKTLDTKVNARLAEQKAAKEQVVAALSGFMVSDAQVKARLAAVLAAAPVYQDLVARMTALNARKATTAQDILDAVQAIDRAATTIVGNQTARIRLRSDLTAQTGRMDPEAIQYVTAMAQRAKARLVKYQYYLLKSYQYWRLRDLPAIDFGATALIDRFAEFLDASSDGSLTPDQFKTLADVVDGELKIVAEEVVDWYQKNPPPVVASFRATLDAAQLDTLNSSANQVRIDLMDMGHISLDHDDVRINGIAVTSVELLDTPPPGVAGNVEITFRHSGTSRLRREGELFQFRSGDLGPTATGRRSPTFWGTTVHRTDGRQDMTPIKPDAGEESLIRYLLNAREGAALQYQPAAWADLTVRRSATPPGFRGRIKHLEFEVSYRARLAVDADRTVVLAMPDGLRPRVRFDVADLNGQREAAQNALRTFDVDRTPAVTLTAPLRYGRRDFLGWSIATSTDGVLPSPGPIDLIALQPGPTGAADLVPGRVLKLDLTKATAFRVTPVYGNPT